MFTRELSPTPVPDDIRRQRLVSPGFGTWFTDHMVTMRWTRGVGWHDARIGPYGPLALDPATLALHYGQAIFEGTKAYRQVDGSLALFRPGENARRLNRSAERMAMPALPEELFVEALRLLVSTDAGWVPEGRGQSLYLRPLVFASEASLTLRPANEYLFVLLAFPSDPVLSPHGRPVTVWVSENYVRSAPGGTGRPSAPAITPPAWRPRPRPSTGAATRSSGSTPSNGDGSRRWAP